MKILALVEKLLRKLLRPPIEIKVGAGSLFPPGPRDVEAARRGLAAIRKTAAEHRNRTTGEPK